MITVLLGSCRPISKRLRKTANSWYFVADSVTSETGAGRGTICSSPKFGSVSLVHRITCLPW